ncbi:hypothetical protein [Rhodocista pekingensis]|uniref:Uncharacterized protein n=1 Tax=Rhodocista pekingensis TaxID=201185 RepID=A0ABW2KZZ0_9PROT
MAVESVGATLERALLVHAVLALLALWPALKLLTRAGLPRAWAAVLALPILGWPVFATYLAVVRWPTLPPRPERLHTRERLRREREARAAAGRG